MLYRIWICTWCLQAAQSVMTDSFYNGTTTLEQQANISDEKRHDRTSHVRFQSEPSKTYEHHVSVSASTNGLLAFARPPPPLPPEHFDRPHFHHSHHAPIKYYPPPSDAYNLYPGPNPGVNFPATAPPLDQFNYVDPGGGGYYGPDDSVTIPLLALKTSLVALFKIAVAKLPILAIKLLAKILALSVLIGPLLLPLVLLFPVPIYSYNGILLDDQGFNNNRFNGNGGSGANTGNRGQQGNVGARVAVKARLPRFAKGPCFPRIACEMGYWGYEERMSFMLDHMTDEMAPVFPKLFQVWKRAYQQGGKGRDCSTLYFCEVADQLFELAYKYHLVAEK